MKIPCANGSIRGLNLTLAQVHRYAFRSVERAEFSVAGLIIWESALCPLSRCQHRCRIVSGERSPRAAQLKNFPSLSVKHERIGGGQHRAAETLLAFTQRFLGFVATLD